MTTCRCRKGSRQDSSSRSGHCSASLCTPAPPNHTLSIYCAATPSFVAVHRCCSASTAAKGSPTPQQQAESCCSRMMHSQKWQDNPTTGPTRHVHHNRRALLKAEGLQLSPGALGDGSMKREHRAQDHGCKVSSTVRVAVALPSCMQLYLLLLSVYKCTGIGKS